MSETGVHTGDLPLTEQVDDLLGNRDGSTVRIPPQKLAQQLARHMAAEVEFDTLETLLASDIPARGDGAIWRAGGLGFQEVDPGSSGGVLVTAAGIHLRPLAAARPNRDFAVTPQHFATPEELEVDADAALIQCANAAASAPGGKMVLPTGLYLASPDLQLLREGLQIEGEGRNRSQIILKPGQGGAALSRSWDPEGPNAYLQDVVLRSFGVILQHPERAAPSNYRQRGIDLSHVTRSLCDDLYVGTYPRGLSENMVPRPANADDAAQGIAFLGMSTSPGPAYSGGEVNRYSGCHVAGAQKGYVLDDPDFILPGAGSASYANHYAHCEAQHCEMGFGQLSKYGAGSMYLDCRVQAVSRATGSSNTTFEFRIDGYDNTIIGGYSESPAADYALYLSATSRRNKVYPRLWDLGVSDRVSDLGTGNIIEIIDPNTNRHKLLSGNRDLNAGRVQAFATWSVVGKQVTVLDSVGVTDVRRRGTGDYQIQFDEGVFDSNGYAHVLSGTVNAAGHPGLVYPHSAGHIEQTGLRLLSRNLATSEVADFERYSAVFHGGQAG
ncbi:hypothetical protein TRL7639_04481 [Falsiruegeria litorea R37]|uniref:Pectate lyase superfamily protein n=1 Tax=Falsiruegeria litorea R37 TaxID=1200284 RepID=A0A1Y5TVN0_9RHOB|nr:hypothetical protein [Falsiruegeria litorea]SLN74033.1 hypothetical protein TRL7639_04481 [Falsiruegeria litorea R37]